MVILVIIAGVIAVQDDVSIYDGRFGRDLHFFGLSKWILVSVPLQLIIACVLRLRQLTKGYELADESDWYLLPICTSVLSLILASLVESGII